MTRDFTAEVFAHEWIAAWNSHNLDAIMSHYDAEVVLISPAAAKICEDPTGIVKGNGAVRQYFQRGLALFPHLQFELVDVMAGLSSVVVCFKNHKGTRTAEFMEFGDSGKVIRVVAHYSS